MPKEAPGDGRESQYNTKIWKTDGGKRERERDLYQPFVEYVGHRPQGDKVPGIFFLTPVDGPTTNVWYKAVPVGRNTLAKQMKTIAYIASLDGKFTNSSGRKTVIQSLREDFHPLEISELTSHANPYSIPSYSDNPLEKQRRMSNKLAGFSKSTTTTVKAAKACGSPRNNATATTQQQWQQQWITAVMVEQRELWMGCFPMYRSTTLQ